MANKEELFCSRAEYIEIIRKFLKQPELLVISAPEKNEENKGDSRGGRGERGNKKEEKSDNKGKGQNKGKKD
jgi:hypothetical protein